MARFFLSALAAFVLTLFFLPLVMVAALWPVSESDGGALRAEVWDPKSGEWSATEPLQHPRTPQVLEVQADGTVVAIGSFRGSDDAESYDPKTNRWSLVAPREPTASPTVPWLEDSNMSILRFPGGAIAWPYDYENPESTKPRPVKVWTADGGWRAAGEGPPLSLAIATRTSDGLWVMVADSAAYVFREAPSKPGAPAETSPPATWQSFTIPERAGQRTVQPLADGTLLIWSSDGTTIEAAVLDPTKQTITSTSTNHWITGDMQTALLPDGRVLAVGGAATEHLVPGGIAIRVGAGLAVIVLVVSVAMLWPRFKPSAGGFALGGVFSFLFQAGLAFLFILAALGAAHGRPIRRDGRRVRSRWRSRSKAEGAVATAVEPRWVGAVWYADAQLEHDSVTAFEELASDLTAHGAPAVLVARAERAAREEAEHTDVCLNIVRAYWPEIDLRSSGEPPKRRGSKSLEEVALEALEDGCFGEGLSAEIALRAAAQASRPELATALSRIGRDEASHAELAWDVLAFAIERGGEPLVARLREAWSRLERRERWRSRIFQLDAGALLGDRAREHGRLGREATARARRRTLGRVGARFAAMQAPAGRPSDRSLPVQ
ncbi:MAG: kelch repeat-containing protein [Polyangiaceae bacterium]